MSNCRTLGQIPHSKQPLTPVLVHRSAIMFFTSGSVPVSSYAPLQSAESINQKAFSRVLLFSSGNLTENSKWKINPCAMPYLGDIFKFSSFTCSLLKALNSNKFNSNSSTTHSLNGEHSYLMGNIKIKCMQLNVAS